MSKGHFESVLGVLHAESSQIWAKFPVKSGVLQDGFNSELLVTKVNLAIDRATDQQHFQWTRKVHLVLSWVLWALLVIWLLFLVAAILILWVIELPATYKLMNHLQYWVAIDILVNVTICLSAVTVFIGLTQLQANHRLRKMIKREVAPVLNEWNQSGNNAIQARLISGCLWSMDCYVRKTVCAMGCKREPARLKFYSNNQHQQQYLSI